MVSHWSHFQVTRHISCPYTVYFSLTSHAQPFRCFCHKLGRFQAVARNHSITSEARQSPTGPTRGHHTIPSGKVHCRHVARTPHDQRATARLSWCIGILRHLLTRARGDLLIAPLCYHRNSSPPNQNYIHLTRTPLSVIGRFKLVPESHLALLAGRFLMTKRRSASSFAGISYIGFLQFGYAKKLLYTLDAQALTLTAMIVAISHSGKTAGGWY